VYKDYVWGGRRIPDIFRRNAPPGVCAESWEVSDRTEGASVVTNGPLRGLTLRDVMRTHAASLLGKANRAAAFPLLIKLIDARDRLSVQVHPDDASAASFGGEAKTEAWHVLAAPTGGYVYAGFNTGVTEAVFRSALREGRIRECLAAVPVAAGDTVFIPGGRVHAIGEGLLILEVQQNSNTTYRLYDWDRTGSDGKPRPLHTEEALRVIRWNDADPARTMPEPFITGRNARGRTLVRCPYFRLDEITLSGPVPARTESAGFEIVFPVGGDLVVAAGKDDAVTVPFGCSCLLPAALGRASIRPSGSAARYLSITGPS
jgi:mannose-6-phosphate isomerase